MTPTERREKYNAWMLDLEQRLAYHLFFNAEKEETLPGKRVIEVVEDEKVGSWVVYFNGKKAFYFDGPDAHQMALRTAEDLSKG